MSNAEGTGKNRRLREFEKQQQAALKEEATPATPPQDEVKEQPAPEKVPEPAVEKTTQAEPVLKTDGIDYREPYRQKTKELEAERQKRKSLEGRMETQTKELRELKRKLEQGEGTPDIVAKVKETDHYKKLAEEYDPETADRVLGIAQYIAEGMAPPREPEPEPTSEPNRFGIASYDEFMVALDGQVEGWDLKYNENPDFIEWAQSNEDPLSGHTYLDLLNRAAKETYDLNSAKRIFSAFDRQVSKTPTPNDYVEPTGSGGDGTAQPEAPTYKESDLKAMERKFRQRKITQKEFEDFNTEFSRAYNEGRVQIGQ